MALTDLLFPVRCGGCGRPGCSPCGECIDALVPLGAIDVAGLDSCVAVVEYEPLSRELIASLKVRGVRGAVPWFVAAMAAAIDHVGLGADTVTWVPSSQIRGRRRGFDQAEALARPLARRLRIPARRLLVRGDDAGQTGRSRAERLEGPCLDARAHCAGAVLVVDDVLTTGASMRRAAVALRRAGAQTVIGAVAAHRTFTDL